LFDAEESSLSGFGWHPHSGIATLTLSLGGSVRYEDTTGAAGFLPPRVEWFKAGRRMARGGCGNSGRSRGFQLWLALPPDQELGRSKASTKNAGRSREGPATVLLGTLGSIKPAKGAVLDQLSGGRLKAGEPGATIAGGSLRLLGRACLRKACCS